MRPGLRIAAAGFAMLAACVQAQKLPAARIHSINDRVHVLLGPVQHPNPQNQGYMVNSTLIIGERGAIVVDPGGSDEVGWHVAAAVLGITFKRVTHVVNTHPHGDHYLGNTAFPGARILSSEACRKLVTERGHEWVAMMEEAIGHKLPTTRAMPAHEVYPPGITGTSIQGVRMVFWVPPGSHTGGDMVVYLPDDKVLIAGDILVNGVVPTLQDGFLRNWIATLDTMQTLDVERFVPGHGPLMKMGDVKALRESLARFHAGVEAGYRKGLSEADIRKTLDLSAWEKLERAHVIGRNINRAYLEVERESFDGGVEERAGIKKPKVSPPSPPSPSPPSPTSPSPPERTH
jgi:glyoxylase-like metal-dependent hydrolase (beta-lactamase superfamily II)